MVTFTSLVAVAVSLAAIRGALASSITAINDCSETIWLHEVYGSFTQVYAVAAGGTAALSQPPDGTGVAVNVYTGCTDNTATSCTTGGVDNDGGATPFIRAEATFTGASVNYDISPLYGYNRAIAISTGDSGCPAVQCVISSGCPVPGADSSCYSPCCASADGCEGTNNCPYDSIYGVEHGGPGVNTPFYHAACPNAYSFPDDDCANYGDSPDASCSDNTDLTITICPSGGSSDLDFC